MTTFIQLHMLTAYAPANLNRDDTGRPKTAIMGGVERLRISSQSLKRAWRTSEMFEDALSSHIGVRTRQLGRKVYQQLIAGVIDEKLAMTISAKIAEQFGSLKKEKAPKDKLDNIDIEQLVHLSPEENQAVEQLVAILIAENREPTDGELKLLRGQAQGVDIALFGRMLASSPEFNVEAACQVAHALGVSAVTIEEDFFTAVDDLNLRENDMGSAFMGERGFASALFYSYICISRDLLLENLNGDETLVKRTLKALTETAMKVSPTGNQNSFASRAYANYALAEIGIQQPRSLAAAFFNPIRVEDQIVKAIQQLQQQRQRFDDAYGACADKYYEMNMEVGNGTLPELLEFIAQ
ncbi:type I-E CRISPR-associated protein Cas7/Cse4/CasC [Limnobaculum parvum]|uniref:Type I-E CRISPR-associated protein Cas7/Cse4/CasC n=1 Tax=Limnobaculum parvum TaxID=2172103 RepID=A0A2Y9TVP9_9GAMM|nr:type I-E CRISPR-associated protein Cas7/Cse4/CasC [Limnobaculum parvum]AWH87651.1 type I-E CRISPR-associated protein Cas7/Cse4/CasC [Limnobaculum parvum]